MKRKFDFGTSNTKFANDLDDFGIKIDFLQLSKIGKISHLVVHEGWELAGRIGELVQTPSISIKKRKSDAWQDSGEVGEAFVENFLMQANGVEKLSPFHHKCVHISACRLQPNVPHAPGNCPPDRCPIVLLISIRPT